MKEAVLPAWCVAQILVAMHASAACSFRPPEKHRSEAKAEAYAAFAAGQDTEALDHYSRSFAHLRQINSSGTGS